MFLSFSHEAAIPLARVLEKLSTIALQFHQCSDVDALLTCGVKQLRELFGCDRALIFQFLPNGDGVVIAESVADGWQPILGQLICDPCFQNEWMEPYRQGRVRAIPDVDRSGLDPCHIDLLTRVQVKANLIAPIVVKSSTDEETRLWGLAIAHQCSAPRTWNALDTEGIKQVAIQIGIALDYLEIRQNFNRVQNHEVRWRAALEGAEEGVWDWNVATNEVFFSPQWKAMLGYEVDEIGNTLNEWSDRVHPKDREVIYAELAKYFSGETPIYHSEHRLLTKDGTWKWILARGKVITWNPDCTPLRMVGTHVDITNLKQAERQLQWQSAALNACADAIVITDRQGRIEWANPAFTNLTGYSFEEALGKNPSELVKSGWQDTEFYRQLWRQILSGRVWRGELVNRRKDGNFYYEEMTITPVRNDRNEILHFIAIKQDATERQQMEQRLRDRDEMLRKISEQVPGVVYQYWLHPNGRSCFPYASEAILQIYEVTPEQVRQDAQAVLDRLHPEDRDRIMERIWQSFYTLELWHDEYRVLLPERGLRWLEGHAMPERLADGSVLWHGYIWDISDRKRTEALLQQEFQRERMAHLIDHHMRESLDLSQILQTAVQEVRQFLDTDRVIVYRLNPDWSGVVVAESVAAGWLAILDMEITDSYFVETQGGTYHDNHFNAVPDVHAAGFSQCHIDLLAQLQVRAKLVVPILQGDRAWGLLIAHHCQGVRHWQRNECSLLQQLANQLAIAIQNAELHQQLQRANAELEQISNTDGLTQVANRRCFDRLLVEEWQRSLRVQQPLALILCDVDYFKQYNDTYGHPKGDACLVAVAKALQQCLKRPADCLTRYGGEEFVAILPNTDTQGAIAVVREMQRAIAALRLEHQTHPISLYVTLSFGIASVVPSQQTTAQTLLNLTDQMLYRAKRSGRDRYEAMGD